MLGNFIGRPFEHRYVETPMPILVTKIYSFEDALERDLLANDNHAGGYIPILAGVLDGAFSDEFGTSVAFNADATYFVGGAEGEAHRLEGHESEPVRLGHREKVQGGRGRR